jgi:hypothetical protein
MPPFFHSHRQITTSGAHCGFALIARHGLLPRFTQKLFEAQTFEPQLNLKRHGRIDRKFVFKWSAENEQKLAQRLSIHLENAPLVRLQ